MTGLGSPAQREAAVLRNVGPRDTGAELPSTSIAKEGRKTNNFYLALRGHPEAVTIDRHIARAYTGQEKLTDAQYDALDARIRREAGAHGVSPRDYQAMVWGGHTGYPFEPPEQHVFHHLANDAEPSMLERYPRLKQMTHEAFTPLEHYSRHMGLEELDPAQMGREGGMGVKGEKKRAERGGYPLRPRAYAYAAGSQPEADVAKANKYSLRVPTARLADIAHMPDIQSMIERGDDAETELFRRGYHGYKNSASAMPHAYALFHKYPLTPF
jgi:hypothetical protein